MHAQCTHTHTHKLSYTHTNTHPPQIHICTCTLTTTHTHPLIHTHSTQTHTHTPESTHTHAHAILFPYRWDIHSCQVSTRQTEEESHQQSLHFQVRPGPLLACSDGLSVGNCEGLPPYICPPVRVALLGSLAIYHQILCDTDSKHPAWQDHILKIFQAWGTGLIFLLLPEKTFCPRGLWVCVEPACMSPVASSLPCPRIPGKTPVSPHFLRWLSRKAPCCPQHISSLFRVEGQRSMVWPSQVLTQARCCVTGPSGCRSLPLTVPHEATAVDFQQLHPWCCGSVRRNMSVSPVLSLIPSFCPFIPGLSPHSFLAQLIFYWNSESFPRSQAFSESVEDLNSDSVTTCVTLISFSDILFRILIYGWPLNDMGLLLYTDYF